MTSILDHQPPKIRSFPIKTEVKWALGIYIYIQNVQRGFRGTRVMPFFSFLVVFGLKAEWSMQPCWLRLIYIYIYIG